MGGAGIRLYSTLLKRSPITTRDAAAPTVERKAHALLPLDHTVTMVAAGSAPWASQCRAPSSSGIEVVRVWPSLDVAVTLPAVGLGATAMV